MCICGRHKVARPEGDLGLISDYRDRDTTGNICPTIGDAPAMCGYERIDATLPRLRLICYYLVQTAVATNISLLAASEEKLR
jgi:hypothetical protein